MPVGLVAASRGGGLVYTVQGDVADLDLFVLLGQPAGPISYRFIVNAGATVSSSASTIPSVDATGFDADATGTWFIDGDITGAGGAGGDGELADTLIFAKGGGGGGGAGAIVGAGGTGVAPATDGADGTATTGGAGGLTAQVVGAGNSAATAGVDGGDAIQLDHVVTIALSGTIAGAGGGGGGAAFTLGQGLPDGGDGGDLGDAGTSGGTSSSPGGDAGYAVRWSGSGDATITGGTVIGTNG